MRETNFSKTDFAYQLPPSLIASHPTPERTDSRLLALHGDSVRHLKFNGLPDLLRPGDLLVVNDTKVIKARLIGHKATGGRVEILIERVETGWIAVCHVKASRGLSHRHHVKIDRFSAKLIDRDEDLFRLEFDSPIRQVIDECGHVPLPNYLERPDTQEDESRYQTVYARSEGAIAAPTAGLHFSKALLQQIRETGIRIEPITLHVGAGTFQPVRDNDLSLVNMHSERYEIPTSTRDAIAQCSGRVVAVGTTVVRTLESAELTGNDEGETNLFISPGFEFKVVDALITNFHLPESTLIMLVCAFCGYERTMNAYDVAVENGYRFYSYGDAMWCKRDDL
ncbi:MAG: tRNA preQ1(34) S-adenosylmethionine ribosyltransferase-isomerase QueA [Gammaproteobacteria bacterium]|nr:tRNA preQ1(34) S-adenosylmethionine ribosyltransferase-isomerase QueA [Gammaproteobacteria bacterium]